MPDCYDAGKQLFESWSNVDAPRNGAVYNSSEFYARWLGEFDINKTVEEVDKIMNEDHNGRSYLVQPAREAFRRGYTRAREDYLSAKK